MFELKIVFPDDEGSWRLDRLLLLLALCFSLLPFSYSWSPHSLPWLGPLSLSNPAPGHQVQDLCRGQRLVRQLQVRLRMRVNHAHHRALLRSVLQPGHGLRGELLVRASEAPLRGAQRAGKRERPPRAADLQQVSMVGPFSGRMLRRTRVGNGACFGSKHVHSFRECSIKLGKVRETAYELVRKSQCAGMGFLMFEVDLRPGQRVCKAQRCLRNKKTDEQPRVQVCLTIYSRNFRPGDFFAFDWSMAGAATFLIETHYSLTYRVDNGCGMLWGGFL